MMRSRQISTSRSDSALSCLLDRYARYGRPITVNFRTLAGWVEYGERATHLIHPYPAKLLPHIPHFFIANEVLSRPQDVILDPFCGSGTVLLESVLLGRNALGVDSNPLARLIARVKTTRYSAQSLLRCASRLVARAEATRAAPVPTVVNLSHWYYPHVIKQLAALRVSVDRTRDPSLRDFFRVCLSATCRKASLADPRLSVPVRLQEDQYPRGHWLREKTNRRIRQLRNQNVIRLFGETVAANVRRAEALSRLHPDGVSGDVCAEDARDLGALRIRPKLIITSPPYAGAQKYIRASSLSLGWVGLMEDRTLRELEDLNIGREHFRTSSVRARPATGIAEADNRLDNIAATNGTRAQIAAVYLVEMREAIREMMRVLLPGGHLVLVAANNSICGTEFPTQKYLSELAQEAGLKTRLELVDDIRSRGLMTRRNRTSSVITREWVSVFQKAG